MNALLVNVNQSGHVALVPEQLIIGTAANPFAASTQNRAVEVLDTSREKVGTVAYSAAAQSMVFNPSFPAFGDLLLNALAQDFSVAKQSRVTNDIANRMAATAQRIGSLRNQLSSKQLQTADALQRAISRLLLDYLHLLQPGVQAQLAPAVEACAHGCSKCCNDYCDPCQCQCRCGHKHHQSTAPAPAVGQIWAPLAQMSPAPIGAATALLAPPVAAGGAALAAPVWAPAAGTAIAETVVAAEVGTVTLAGGTTTVSTGGTVIVTGGTASGSGAAAGTGSAVVGGAVAVLPLIALIAGMLALGAVTFAEASRRMLLILAALTLQQALEHIMFQIKFKIATIIRFKLMMEGLSDEQIAKIRECFDKFLKALQKVLEEAIEDFLAGNITTKFDLKQIIDQINDLLDDLIRCLGENGVPDYQLALIRLQLRDVIKNSILIRKLLEKISTIFGLGGLAGLLDGLTAPQPDRNRLREWGHVFRGYERKGGFGFEEFPDDREENPDISEEDPTEEVDPDTLFIDPDMSLGNFDCEQLLRRYRALKGYVSRLAQERIDLFKRIERLLRSSDAAERDAGARLLPALDQFKAHVRSIIKALRNTMEALQQRPCEEPGSDELQKLEDSLRELEALLIDDPLLTNEFGKRRRKPLRPWRN